MLRVTTVLTGAAGFPAYNNLYFGGTTEGEAQAAASAVREFWNDLALTLVGNFSAFVQSDVPSVSVATGQTIQNFVTSTLEVGFTQTGDALPNATQALVQLRTGTYVAGRELRGRMFIPRFGETASANGVPLAGVITLLNQAVADLRTAAVGAEGLGVYSTTHRQFALVTDHSTWSQWAVLRSRRD